MGAVPLPVALNPRRCLLETPEFSMSLVEDKTFALNSISGQARRLLCELEPVGVLSHPRLSHPGPGTCEPCFRIHSDQGQRSIRSQEGGSAQTGEREGEVRSLKRDSILQPTTWHDTTRLAKRDLEGAI